MLNDVLESEPLRKALQRTLVLALEHGTNELATWLRLELGGYVSNFAMDDKIEVPKYRTVCVTYYNAFGQQLRVGAELSYLNQIRLPLGVEVLESLKDTRQTVVLQDMTIIEFIAQHFKVEVSTFHIDKAQIIGVLSQIRSELSIRAQVLAGFSSSPAKNKKVKGEEIIMLSPNVYGVGLNLRALWRRMVSGKK